MKTVSAFGRVADALVDKIVVCGAFVFLIPKHVGVQPWMVAVILGREFLVSSLRSMLEARGIPFGAEWPGKLKTLSQNLAIAIATLGLGMAGDTRFDQYSPAWWWVNAGCMYLAVVLTLYSGVEYVLKAWRLFQIDETL
jgi:CDP-diacylglycerol--glycerol-3-phosphate 3-phosphatidyltransferase